MAGSRLERVGTIYTRTTGLFRAGALTWEDRPLWYDIYKGFPPKEEPKFDRPVPNIKLRQIFFKDDNIRAQFHNNNKQIGTTNMFNNNDKSLTQRFIDIYRRLETGQKCEINDIELYQETVELLKNEDEVKRKQIRGDDEYINLSTAFKNAKSQQQKNQETSKININVTDIFN